MKAVLLHNGGGEKQPSVPIAYSKSDKVAETYKDIDMLIKEIKYDQYNWMVVADLKIVAILAGLQGGNVKHPCFICEWDRTNKNMTIDDQYAKKNWPLRTTMEVGKFNVVHKDALVPLRRILAPPLHIKIGLVSKFVKGLKKDSKAFAYLKELFPKMTADKINSGIFVGPQIKTLMSPKSDFVKLLEPHERRAWVAFQAVCEFFFGNELSPHYRDFVDEMLKAFKEMGITMSLKIHFLNSHLERLTEHGYTLGQVSDEQGERFHQEIAQIEKNFKSSAVQHGYAGMLGDYCWQQSSDEFNPKHNRKTKQVRFGAPRKDAPGPSCLKKTGGTKAKTSKRRGGQRTGIGVSEVNRRQLNSSELVGMRRNEMK
jgi:hypothetical protein